MIGTVANGDFVAVDMRDKIGAVGYICHETFHKAPEVWDVYIEVAESLDDFGRLLRTGQMPIDYFDAKRDG